MAKSKGRRPQSKKSQPMASDPLRRQNQTSRRTPLSELDRRVEFALQRHKAGDLQYAYGAYRDALTQNPDHPAALHYMGLIAQQTGQPEQAVRLLMRSIELDPGDPRTYNHLGQVFVGLKRMSEAEQCFRKAVDVDPNHIDSLNNLANILKINGELDNAISLYRKVLELQPNATNSTYNLANALKDKRSYDEAIDWYRQTIKIDPCHVHSHQNLAVTLEQKGHFKEAISHYLSALKSDPHHIKALSNLIAIKSYQPDQTMVEKAIAILDDSKIEEDDRIKLNHGLGKHFDRIGEYDTAFQYFARAAAVFNERNPPFDVSLIAGRFEHVIKAFSKEHFERVSAFGNKSERPVFIVGMPRSGTTLTEQILASHPQVFGAGELQEITQISGKLDFQYPEEIDRMDARLIEETAQQFLRHIDALAPASAVRITDKLPANFIHLGLIATLFPNAHIIHCRRAPLDIGLSCFIELFEMSHDYTTNLEHFGQYFLLYDRMMAHWRKVLPMPIHELRYETLIADQEMQSRELVRFCGLEWDEACLTYHKTDRAVMTPSRWQVRQPIYSSSIGRWKNYASHMEPLRRLLEQSGYEYDEGGGS